MTDHGPHNTDHGPHNRDAFAPYSHTCILPNCPAGQFLTRGFANMESAQIEAAESLAHMVKHLTWRVSDPSVRLDCTRAAPFLRIYSANFLDGKKRKQTHLSQMGDLTKSTNIVTFRQLLP